MIYNKLKKFLEYGIDKDDENTTLVRTIYIFNIITFFGAISFIISVSFLYLFQNYKLVSLITQVIFILYSVFYYLLKGNNIKVKYAYFTYIFIFPLILILNFFYVVYYFNESPLTSYIVVIMGFLTFFAVANLFSMYDLQKKYTVVVIVFFFYFITFDLLIYAFGIDIFHSEVPTASIIKLFLIIKIISIVFVLVLIHYRTSSIKKQLDLIDKNKQIEIRKLELEKQKSIIIEQTSKLKESITNLNISNELLKRSNFKLETLVNNKNQFISMLSRDIRDKLSGAFLTLELMVKYGSSMKHEEVSKNIKKVYYDIEFLNESLDAILTWSKHSMDDTNTFPQYFLLSNLTDRALQHFQNKIQQKNITINKSYNSDNLTFADEQMMLSTIKHLISNAIKFTEENGSIDIAIYQTDEEQYFRITNYGKTLDKETFDKIINSDERITTIGTKGERGTGIGLKLCKIFIEKNNGLLFCDNFHPNSTTIIFSLKKHI